MKTGAELKARRLELGITQHDLADKIGVSRTQLSRMENGKIEISSDIYMKIEAVLTSNEEYKEPELTINDIQVGDELECIDRDGFINGLSPRTNKNILEHPIIISHFGEYGAYLTIESWLEENELKYFRKKPKLQFSDLEVGDYVYVRDDLIEHQGYGCNSYVSEIGNGIQQIKSFHSEYSQFRTNKSDYWVTPEMLDLSRSIKKEDYLKMNEKENFSFDSLVDVARKGFKDGVVSYYGQSVSVVNIEANGEQRAFNSHFIKDGIEFVQSLYTEEFIIETMSDELKIKSGAQLILSNGMKCVYFDDGERKLRHDGDYYPCNFLVLKGAAVKQSKGAK